MLNIWGRKSAARVWAFFFSGLTENRGAGSFCVRLICNKAHMTRGAARPALSVVIGRGCCAAGRRRVHGLTV